MKGVLHLTIKKKWFDLIKSGEKKEEYRDRKPYWLSRLFNKDGSIKMYEFIEFRNGYSPKSPTLLVEFGGLGMTEDKIIIHIGRMVDENTLLRNCRV